MQNKLKRSEKARTSSKKEVVAIKAPSIES